MSRGARVLYLSYDGLTDPLGQSQVLPYLSGLAAKGHEVSIVSCEKPDAYEARRESVAVQCADAGIDWHPLPYRKRPPVLSTVLDLFAMRRRAFALHRRKAFDVIHCRSYLPAIIGRALKRATGVKFLFDMRGFWIDERFERGIWPRGSLIYGVVERYLRQQERGAFEDADAVVSLTASARRLLGEKGGPAWPPKTAVIPCCADLGLFDPAGGKARERGRAILRLDDRTPVLLFLGSLGGAYPLEPVATFFDRWAVDRPDARLLFVTRHPEAAVRGDPAMRDLGDRLVVRAGERSEVPLLVAACDAGLSFILHSFCAVATSPTKVGEMLAMGVPVVANAGVGDMPSIMAEPGAGVLVADLSAAAIADAADALRRLPSDPEAARAVAERYFSLEMGVLEYDRVYRRLLTV